MTEAIVVLGLLVALTVVVGTLLGRLVLARERAAARLCAREMPPADTWRCASSAAVAA